MNIIKRILIAVLIFLCFSYTFGLELKAKDIVKNATKQENINESINYLQNQAEKISSPTEKRAIYIFLASLQEQANYFDKAQVSYAKAASISAGDAEDMPKKTNEQLVLDAVRCALNSGDYESANNYLNSAVRNSKDEKIQAYIKLYAQWAQLCKANNVQDLQEPILMLQTYLKLDSMSYVHSSILLTLWYITGDKTYSDQILKNYSGSLEANIVNGDIQLLPTPFWFFVPKMGIAEAGTGTYKTENTVEAPKEKTVQTQKSESKTNKITKLQLGLFRTEANAKLLADEVQKKGFNPYITTETRASGTTYYLVLVNEDSNQSIADKLRSAGYDCYVIE